MKHEFIDAPGTDVMNLKYFRLKIGEKMSVFGSKQSKIMNKFDHNIGFR
jgi:hypothetical protein